MLPTGTVDLAFVAREAVGDTGRVVAIDFSEPMLDIARRKAAERSVHVEWQRGDALHLPFAADEFDAATCGFGLRNFDDRASALAEMTRTVRPGKRVVILKLTPATNPLGDATWTTLYLDWANRGASTGRIRIPAGVGPGLSRRHDARTHDAASRSTRRDLPAAQPWNGSPALGTKPLHG